MFYSLRMVRQARDEAESVYRADLSRHPHNLWSLRGLAECARARGAPASVVQDAEARALRAAARFDAGTAIASCLCAGRPRAKCAATAVAGPYG